jgi:transposase
VDKRSTVYCQMREHLHAAMPGFAELFDDLWESQVALAVARHVGSVSALRDLGEEGLTQWLRRVPLRFHHRTVARIGAWAMAAVETDPDADIHHRLWGALDEDRTAKCRQIEALEREIASLLVRTPYALLLSIPGINVVSAADFAAEMGPIHHYANAKRITGRAGLFPSRYQSDQVDHADGPLVRCANRRLRAAILMVADNLIQCNDYFRAKADLWKAMGKDPRHTHVKIGMRFTRIAFHMVAGGQVFHHPCCQKRSYILDKFLVFHQEHRTPPEQMLKDLQEVIQHLPRREYQAEAQPLIELLNKTQTARRREPQPIGQILPLVLAKLGLQRVQSETSGGQDPSLSSRTGDPQRLPKPMG